MHEAYPSRVACTDCSTSEHGDRKCNRTQIASFLKTCSVSLLALTGASLQAANEIDLTPIPVTGDNVYTTETINGQNVWSSTGYVYFDVPNVGWFSPGQDMYLRIEYLDTGKGYLNLNYDAVNNQWSGPGTGARSSRVNSGSFVYGYKELANANLGNRQNYGADFRLSLGNNGGTPWKIARVTISDEPFGDPNFLTALSKPWLTPYSGPVKDFVDNQTLSGKVMAGYQGWFRTPNDVEDKGWGHWHRGGSNFAREDVTVDMWPYMAEYDYADWKLADQLTLENSDDAYVFSSADYQIVKKHFHWMRKYNVDGVYLQRFITPTETSNPQFVLHNVMRAAAEEGRVWAIEYDISSLPNNNDPASYNTIVNDWQFLVNDCGILNSPRYLHENGKPVVFVWGFGFADRGHSVQLANDVINYFKNQGLYVIGGSPRDWSSATGDWLSHYQSYDQILAWQNGWGLNTSQMQDFKNTADNWGIKYLPHVWPGFSWRNLKRLANNDYFSRNGGQYYWDYIHLALNTGFDQIFIGMFDEYDEATAILPMSNDHPSETFSYTDPDTGATSQIGGFVDNNETNAGTSPFWWLRLSGAAKDVLDGKLSLSSTMPLESQLNPLPHSGRDASSYLRNVTVNEGLSLTQPQPGDGDTVSIVKGNQEAAIRVAANDYYMYFRLDDSLASAVTDGLEVSVEVEYYDEVSSTLRLQYDSTSAAYRNHPTIHTTPGTGGWKTASWTLTDGYFGNRQNNQSDFRVYMPSSQSIAIRRVSVFFPESDIGKQFKAIDFDAESHPDTNNTIRINGIFVDKTRDNSWFMHESVNFDEGFASLTLTAANSSSNNRTVELRLDSPTGPLLAAVTVSPTGGATNFEDFAVTPSLSATGQHDLYIVFTRTAVRAKELMFHAYDATQ